MKIVENICQIVYQDRAPQTNLLDATQCGALFNPPLGAAEFAHWAKLNNCPPDGAIVKDGSIVGPAWTRGRVRVRRHSVMVATRRKVQRWEKKNRTPVVA